MERNDDLISRSALIAEYDRVHVGAPGGARKLMQDAPAVDAVEVVRCRDCVRAEEVPGIAGARYCMRHRKVFFDTDFCARGRRRTKMDGD